MKRYVPLFLLVVFVLTCKDKSNTTNSSVDNQAERISILDTLPITSNANGKWIVNAETQHGFEKMDSILRTFSDKEEKDYKTLGEQLAKQTGFIIKHCSMKGEAHDQLHIVLIPMLDEISVLREENNINKTEFAFRNLEQLTSAYFKYFKI